MVVTMLMKNLAEWQENIVIKDNKSDNYAWILIHDNEDTYLCNLKSKILKVLKDF